MPLILGANSASGGYNVANSLRFNSGSSDNLSRTPSSTTDRQKWTISFWVKRSKLSTDNIIYSQGSTSGALAYFYFASTDKFGIAFDTEASGNFRSTMVFRDVSAWYHIVVACDTTQATSTNRVKVYVNGSQITNSTETQPTQNYNTQVNTNTISKIGVQSDSASGFVDCYLSEYYLIDGQQLTPTSFGETDEDTNIWKPIPYTGSFGTNGFYLQFKNSAALGTDSSGNGNTFTVNNLTSIDQSTDTPTNNFCTMNPLYKWTYNLTLTEGNLSCAGTQNQWQGAIGSMGISKGKWYYEVKFTSATNIGDFYIGFGGLDNFVFGSPAFRNAVAFYNFDGGEINVADTSNTTVTTANYGTFANGDIMGVALDYDNELITIYKNGSAIVTNFDYGSATYPSTLINGKTISPVVGHYGSGSVSFNFGNPPFTISSGNADADGFGNFEYAVPSGYFALCTKNLAEYG
jgi:hypothetical protein